MTLTQILLRSIVSCGVLLGVAMLLDQMIGPIGWLNRIAGAVVLIVVTLIAALGITALWSY